MSFQTWNETVQAAVADAAAIANTTTETAIYQQTILGNFMYPGRRLRLQSWGKLSTTGTPTITFVLRWGGAVSGVLLATTEAITNGSGVTNVNWAVEAVLTCRTIGTSGTILAFGNVKVNTSSSAVAEGVFGISGFDAPAVATVDTTIDKILALCATWGTQSASNTLTGMDFALESMN